MFCELEVRPNTCSGELEVHRNSKTGELAVQQIKSDLRTASSSKINGSLNVEFIKLEGSVNSTLTKTPRQGEHTVHQNSTAR